MSDENIPFNQSEIDAQADIELDLRSSDEKHALDRLRIAIEKSWFEDVKSMLVRIQQATPTSGQTLFQPVGRFLLQAKRQGAIRRCTPMSLDTGPAFLVEFQRG